MIFNANSQNLTDVNTGLPQMGSTLEGWFQNIVVGIITKTMVNNRVVETTVNTDTKGVVQPFSDEQLAILPEGQRSWPWYMIHCQPSLSLRTDDTITIKGDRYRVMGRGNYDAYGFAQYNLVKDYDTLIANTADQ